MAEYIERETALREAESRIMWGASAAAVYESIRDVPAADVAPVRHGRWIEHKHFHHDNYIDSTYECSECKVEEPFTSNYCPNCGARMEGDE